VLMGGFTCASGIVLGLFLPDSFKKPRSTFLPNVRIFTERELHILNTRVLMDDPMKGQKKKRIGRAAFIKLVSRLFLPAISQSPSDNNQNSSQATQLWFPCTHFQRLGVRRSLHPDSSLVWILIRFRSLVSTQALANL
jgi:hypothetical protein